MGSFTRNRGSHYQSLDKLKNIEIVGNKGEFEAEDEEEDDLDFYLTGAEKTDKNTQNSPEVISIEGSQESPILIDNSQENSAEVDLISSGETSEKSKSVNKSPKNAPSTGTSPLKNIVPTGGSPKNPPPTDKSRLSGSATADEPSTPSASGKSPKDGKPSVVAESAPRPTPEIIDLIDLDEPVVIPPPPPLRKISTPSTSFSKSPEDCETSVATKSAPEQPTPEIIDLTDLDEPAVTPLPPPPRRTLDCFFVNYVSNASIYTCRQCYKTYISSNAALTHICEDSQPVEPEEPPEKTLPPLKIRVATSSNGKHICELCKISFTRRTSLVTHQKTTHFSLVEESGDCSEESPKKKKKRIKSKGGSGLEDSYKSKRRKQNRENLQPTGYQEFNGALNNNICGNIAGEKSCQNDEVSFLICDVCDEPCLNKTALEEHKKKHSRGKSVPSNKNEENDDIFNFQDDKIETEACVYCDKKLANHSERLRHEKKHLLSLLSLQPKQSDESYSKEKKSELGESSSLNVYICDTCSVSFDRKSAYLAHIKTHDDDILIEDSCSEDEKSHRILKFGQY